ncbi:MAG: hypothetical protein ACT4UP_09210 [Gammaproteobacteria bacterium]
MMRPRLTLGARMIAVAACVAPVLAGCLSTSAVYPSTWPDQVVLEDGVCPVIDGSYRNAGESVSRYGGNTLRGRRSLAHILNGGTGRTSLELWNRLGHTAADPARDPFVSVSLRLAGGKLDITAEAADGSRRVQNLPVATRCRDSVLALDVDWGKHFQMPLDPFQETPGRIALVFGRAADGSLLVRETETATYMLLAMPAFSLRDEAWLRFREAPAALTAAGAP